MGGFTLGVLRELAQEEICQLPVLPRPHFCQANPVFLMVATNTQEKNKTKPLHYTQHNNRNKHSPQTHTTDSKQHKHTPREMTDATNTEEQKEKHKTPPLHFTKHTTGTNTVTTHTHTHTHTQHTHTQIHKHSSVAQVKTGSKLTLFYHSLHFRHLCHTLLLQPLLQATQQLPKIHLQVHTADGGVLKVVGRDMMWSEVR